MFIRLLAGGKTMARLCLARKSLVSGSVSGLVVKELVLLKGHVRPLPS